MYVNAVCSFTVFLHQATTTEHTYLAAAPDVVLHLAVAVAGADVHLGSQHLLDVLLPDDGNTRGADQRRYIARPQGHGAKRCGARRRSSGCVSLRRGFSRSLRALGACRQLAPPCVLSEAAINT